MAENDIDFSNTEMAGLVAGSRRLDDHRFEVTLVDGSKVIVDDQGNRISSSIENPLGMTLQTLTMDDVGDVRNATAPTRLTSSGPGASATWDLHSIEDAERWLRAHADTLAQLWHGMDDISDLLDGPDGRTPSLGTFEWGNNLNEQHGRVFEGVKTGMQGVVERLYDAADAIREVATNIRTAEERNRMSAAQMESIFGEQAEGEHDF